MIFISHGGEEQLTLHQYQVWQVLQNNNIGKAAGPDNVPDRLLQASASQLAAVFTDIYQSLRQATVPACLKIAPIVPVPKSSAVTSITDNQPIALTPVIMKYFERLILSNIKACIPPSLDRQFAYKADRSTDNAI